MNDPLCLVNPFRSFGWILPIFSKEKIQEQIWEHVVSKCKEDELKVSVSAISDIRKRVWMYLCQEFIVKITRLSRKGFIQALQLMSVL